MRVLLNDGRPFRSADLASVGFTGGHAWRQAVAEKRVRPVFKSVYVDARVPDTRMLRVSAVRLVTPPHAVVSDCFASWLWGVDTFRPSERHLLTPTLVVPHGSGRVRAPGVLCRQAVLPVTDTTDIDGIRVTTAIRTASDLLRKMWRPYALAAADGLVRAELLALPDLEEYVRALKGYRGAPQARELVGLVDPGAESRGESWQRLRIIDAGLPRPTTQLHVVDEWGRDRYFDLGYRHLLVASEYDGREFHTTDEDRAHDAARRSSFERRYGWRFVIGTRERIIGTDTSFEQELGALLGMTPRLRTW
ncbi:hypothetical protein [Mumia zhuanghuii]|uniref:DUF559 domain-containing protein n=1 Tax=Mumia zhuanghuii TaxID=2585211 RepID=A0A5C4MWG3_9ACTN|nr:hypothetical protein [Mumia zhuanghuii]TNC49715.1 hypothetical protein FHE65_04790 [Mumia zhuanghuii]TNC49980.1 hypothetical protein FHE65_04665 [Mumia zhuanghuii]